MNQQPTQLGISRQPLLLAAALFLLGVSLGSHLGGTGIFLTAAGGAWTMWALAEWRGWWRLASLALASSIILAGGMTWRLHQYHVASSHVVRQTPAQVETMVTLRVAVLVSPRAYEMDMERRGDRRWIARATEVLTESGWREASGDILVTSADAETLAAGASVELYGWISRPEPALNPGGYDARQALSADRVFVQMRVPRESGVVVLDKAGAHEDAWLPRMRNALRAKLLEHLIQEDVPAAQTLAALLLGYREPAISDVSQSFADAGVAHLLAISGSHIVFFAGLVWAVLRFVPLRPRWRELLIAGIVGIYILATPCGPPIVRAGIMLLMLLLGRFAGRPREYLNMLAAAAVAVVLLRPTDLVDAGFQLSFVSTAGLILFSERLHRVMFGQWLERLALVAALAQSRWSRWKLRGARVIAAALTANAIGAVTAAPLVAYHFGQINGWAVAAGLLAMPAVMVAMFLAAVQLLLALVGLGAVLAVPVSWSGQFMMWVVEHLARLPGSVVAVRAPPMWVVMMMYGVMLLAAMRKRLGWSRAALVNMALGAMAITASWYLLSDRQRQAEITVLSAGTSSCTLLRTPRGTLWVIDAGADTGKATYAQTLRPTLQREGVRKIDGLLLTGLDAAHAREGALVCRQAAPAQVVAGDAWWKAREGQYAGQRLSDALDERNMSPRLLHEGEVVELDGCQVHVLWPPRGGQMPERRELVLLLEMEGKRILIADPGAAGVLALFPQVRCDVAILTGPQSGSRDEDVRRALRREGMPILVWNGRGPWAEERSRDGERNTAEGAVQVRVSGGVVSMNGPGDF